MGDDRPFPKRLDVRGELDTSMPIGDRPPGTLYAAPDCESKAWGPRRGSLAFTQAQEGPGTASLYDAITLNYATAGAFGVARTYEDSFRDLGTTFTLDLWFRLEDLVYSALKNSVGLYNFDPSQGVGAGISVDVRGPNHADHERIFVTIGTSPTRSTAASPVTLTGATRISTGTAQSNKHHVRLVRSGANLYLYLDGVLDGSSSGLSATNPINGPIGSFAAVILGYSNTADISFKGHVYGAWLRDGAFTSQPIEARMPSAPWARHVHHAYMGRNIALGSSPSFFDAGRFGAHAPLHYGAANDYTVTSSNDNAAPAPVLVQGIRSWMTRTNRTATSVMVGGQLATAVVS